MSFCKEYKLTINREDIYKDVEYRYIHTYYISWCRESVTYVVLVEYINTVFVALVVQLVVKHHSAAGETCEMKIQVSRLDPLRNNVFTTAASGGTLSLSKTRSVS